MENALSNLMNPEKREINHVRFYFDKIEKYQKCLNNEQMGRLFFAVADYAMTGARRDVEGDILYPYDEAVYSIDRTKAR